MNLVSAVPAAERARGAVVVAVLGALLVGLGCWMAVAAPRRGVIIAFLGLVTVHVGIRRRQDLVLLHALRDRRVGQIAERIPVLRRYGSIDGLAELREMAGHEVGVVPTDAGWRLLTREDVAEAVFAAADRRFSGDWSPYLREVPSVDARLPTSRLRRVPSGSEHWLVADGIRTPRVVTAGTIHRAVRRDRTTGFTRGHARLVVPSPRKASAWDRERDLDRGR